jgi:tetratricopeptide (TPR) repeat protein
MEGRQRGRSDLNSQGLDQGTLVTGREDRKRTRNSGKEHGELTVLEPEHQSLERVNKLVFVREFETAFLEIRQICVNDSSHIEGLFRLVEIGVRIDKQQELNLLLAELEATVSEVNQKIAIQVARLLCEIRSIEQIVDSDSEEQLVNPSLRQAEGFSGLGSAENFGTGRDVVALGSRDPEFGSGLTLGRSYLGLAGLESSRRGYIIGKSGRVARAPLVADDYSPFDPNKLELEDFERSSLSASQDKSSPNDEDAARILAESSDLLVAFPDSYAVWYVHGCASELAGHLSQAMDSWINAYRRNPKSLAVLSTMSELQQMGALGSRQEVDYGKLFESVDRFAVHGTLDTHTALYHEFLLGGEYRLAIAALRTLADWLQRQKGEVPPEIEILCLLGAMKAHRLEGNSGAAESCRREAENLAVSFKKSQQDLVALAFVAARAEEFEIPSLARMCYFSIISSPLAAKDLVMRVAAHCVSQHTSRALAECLKSAYKIHRGDSEIRFCQVLCALALSNVSVKGYLERKSQIRELLAREELADAITLLQECARQVTEDPEVHYYLAEVYSRLGAEQLAAKHYESMYDLDSLNTESVIRYIQFLLKIKHYEESEVCARHLLENGYVTTEQEGEIHWSMAASAFAREQLEYSRIAIDRALSCDPWNMSFLALAMRLTSPGIVSDFPRGDELRDSETLLTQFEDSILGEAEALTHDFVSRWVAHGIKIVRAGYFDFGFLMACAVFRDWHTDDAVCEFMSIAGAAHNSRLATQRMMLLLQRSHSDGRSGKKSINQKSGSGSGVSNRELLGHLSLCMARTYAHAGEWPLVDEWVDIATKTGIESPSSKAVLFSLEALRLIFSGTRIERARALLEAAIDCSDRKGPEAEQLAVAYGYVLVLQGELKPGIERIQQNIKHSSSILSLYFAVKALERSGQLKRLGSDVLERLFACIPSTQLESKLVDEVHVVVGSLKQGAVVNLRC